MTGMLEVDVTPTRGREPRSGHARVLVVEGDERFGVLLCELLRGGGYDCVISADAGEAARLLAAQDFDALICDAQLPDEAGTELLEATADQHPRVARVMLSEADDRDLIERAVALGVAGYITKPFSRNEVLLAVGGALRRRRLEAENHELRTQVKASRERRPSDAEEALHRLQDAAGKVARSHEETILRLTQAIEYHDGETAGHVERVSRYSMLLAEFADVPADMVRVASMMHDVGKIAVGPNILQKQGELTSVERQGMERHCEIGYGLLCGSDSELLELAAGIALTHHERVDGAGYPQGLSGEDIPAEGRIVAVSDVFDALTSDRAYRPAFPVEEALAIMRDGRGTQFDPRILDCFLGCLDQVEAIRTTLAD